MRLAGYGVGPRYIKDNSGVHIFHLKLHHLFNAFNTFFYIKKRLTNPFLYFLKTVIESGAMGGRGSEAHQAALAGDTVGDPLKDTTGASLHVLMKLQATLVLILTPIFLDIALWVE